MYTSFFFGTKQSYKSRAHRNSRDCPDRNCCNPNCSTRDCGQRNCGTRDCGTTAPPKRDCNAKVRSSTHSTNRDLRAAHGAQLPGTASAFRPWKTRTVSSCMNLENAFELGSARILCTQPAKVSAQWCLCSWSIAASHSSFHQAKSFF